MRSFLVEHGVAEEWIVLEDRSRNTFENARDTANLLHRDNVTTVVLVTDAIHLPRAVRCFEAQRLQVIPSGVRYRATGFEPGLHEFLPSAAAAAANQQVLHEWLGMAWYWMNGRFDRIDSRP
jgi:uncharacterized SAM-binding protein YcdF (DUF218 family)